MSDTAFEFFDSKEELLDGKIVALASPTINHYRVCRNVLRELERNLAGKNRNCEAFGEGIDVYLEKDIVIPDALVVCDKSIIKNRGIMGVPDIIVEVLSPGTETKDRGYKKELYERSGVKEYWIVDINNRAVEKYILVNEKYILGKSGITINSDEIFKDLLTD